tara:strand:- start:872 stop:1468 length:597 start_codon:yes stop_codon:yes gene_type:complete
MKKMQLSASMLSDLKYILLRTQKLLRQFSRSYGDEESLEIEKAIREQQSCYNTIHEKISGKKRKISETHSFASIQIRVATLEHQVFLLQNVTKDITSIANIQNLEREDAIEIHFRLSSIIDIIGEIRTIEIMKKGRPAGRKPYGKEWCPILAKWVLSSEPTRNVNQDVIEGNEKIDIMTSAVELDSTEKLIICEFENI